MRARALAMAMLAAMMVGWVAPAAAQAPADTLIVTRLSDFPTCFHPICFQTGNQYMNLQLLYNTLVKVDAGREHVSSRTWPTPGRSRPTRRVHVQAEPERQVA